MTKRQIVIVSDHPDLSTGFARVSDSIASFLAESGMYHVTLMSRLYKSNQTEFRGYSIDIIGDNPVKPVDNSLFIKHITNVLNSIKKEEKIILLLIDNAEEQLKRLNCLQSLQLRNRIFAISYIPIDFTPPSEKFARLASQVDLVIPYSQFGREALLAVREKKWNSIIEKSLSSKNIMTSHISEISYPPERISNPIPHCVDIEKFYPSSTEDREITRKQVFHADENDIVVGFFSRNTDRKRIDRLMMIFWLWSTGSYVKCTKDGSITAFTVNPADMSLTPPACCEKCGSTDFVHALPKDNSKLYIHSSILNEQECAQAMGWNLPELVNLLKLEKTVILESSLRPGSGIPIEELSRRMGACDIHFLPYMGGGWELTILETAACGVPNIITDIATPVEYAAPFSCLVPVESYRLRRYGFDGIMDMNLGLEALVKLGESRQERTRLGKAGIDVSQKYSQQKVGEKWLELIENQFSK